MTVTTYKSSHTYKTGSNKGVKSITRKLVCKESLITLSVAKTIGAKGYAISYCSTCVGGGLSYKVAMMAAKVAILTCPTNKIEDIRNAVASAIQSQK